MKLFLLSERPLGEDDAAMMFGFTPATVSYSHCDPRATENRDTHSEGLLISLGDECFGVF
jgi:hypothetical protein